VSDLFAPPGHEWRPVSPQLATMRRLVLVVVVAAALVATGLVALLVHAWPWLLLPVAGLLTLSGFGWPLIGRNAAAWGYAERDEDLYIKHGVMYKELVAVPYGRMQFVDVTSGPLEQLFGIASVHLHTASARTSARIPGLPREEAARLRDRLTSLGETQAAGL
jgi:membrane protein YdbS with pleckstrin-like domain